jgi:hypothetical protein
MEELEEALDTPVDMNAREQFVRDFLLTPSEGMPRILEALARYG